MGHAVSETINSANYETRHKEEGCTTAFNEMAKMHRVLVIGVGSIGERHLRCIKATGRVALAANQTGE